MLTVLIIACFSIISHVSCAPRPQEETVDIQPTAFSIENLPQLKGLPQGFTVPNRDARQATSADSAADDSLTPFGFVRYFYERDEFSYRFTYELVDGTIRSEAGAYKDGVDEEGNPVKVLVVQGAFSWVGPDGQTYWTNYESDEQGYRPKTGKGVGGIKPGQDESIDPNLLKSLVG